MACELADRGKPTFTLSEFVAALADNATGLPSLRAAFLGPARIDPALREGVLVSVSRMNRCRHCTAIHSAWSEAIGAPAAEEPLASAARYARCLLAGTDPGEARRTLARQLPEEAIAQVEALARLIDFTNRCGNTWDAFEARFTGTPRPRSRLLDELAVLLALAPFGAPFLLLSKRLRLRRGEPDLASLG